LRRCDPSLRAICNCARHRACGAHLRCVPSRKFLSCIGHCPGRVAMIRTMAAVEELGWSQGFQRGKDGCVGPTFPSQRYSAGWIEFLQRATIKYRRHISAGNNLDCMSLSNFGILSLISATFIRSARCVTIVASSLMLHICERTYSVVAHTNESLKGPCQRIVDSNLRRKESSD
jgi:hypothetical protein